MAGDWIKLFRKTTESPIWQDAELLRLFVWCLFRANWKDTEVSVDGIIVPVKIKRGQFITGRNAMHKELFPRRKKANPAPRTVWRWLLALQTMQNVTIETTNKYSIVTVCNYDTYQTQQDDNVQVIGQVMSNRCPSDVQQVSKSCPSDVQVVSTEKEGKELKEGKEQKEGKEGKDSKVVAVRTKTSDINAVIEHYKKHQKHCRPGDDERKKISARLKDGYSVADICKAIDGNHKSPYHNGENKLGNEYHSLELIVRNSSQVATFMKAADKSGPVLSAKTQKSARAVASWVGRNQPKGESDAGI